MKLQINHHDFELLLTEEQCIAFFKLQTVQDLVIYLQSICNVTEEIKTLSIDDQEIDVSVEGLQLSLKQVQSLLPLLTLRELPRLPVELVSQVLSYTDAKTVHALLSLPSRIKPPAMNNHFGSELGKQILTAHFQVDESLWKAFEQFTQKEQVAGKVSAFATWFQNGDLKSFLALINVKNQTPLRMNDRFFLSWVTIFGPSVMAAYKEVAAATIEQKILYALVAPTNLIDPRMFAEILMAESSARANYSSLIESLRLTQKVMQIKNNTAELEQIKATLRDRQFAYINFANMNFQSVNFSGANLSFANLSGTNLSSAKLIEADLRRADLRGVDLSDTELTEADCRGADLRGVKLRYADLRNADFSGANFTDTNLSGVYFTIAILKGANFSNVVLKKAFFEAANLSGANLSGANLKGANLNAADLSYFTWGDQMVNFPNFQDANLAGVRMDFSVFDGLPISALNSIQVKTLAFLSWQIAQTKTLTQVDAIMTNNRNGILYLAQTSQLDATPTIGKFFPSNAEKLPNSAREFEAAIAARKAELQDKLQSQASSSASALRL